jgi:predicted ATPase
MNEKLIVKDFGPIKNAELDLKKVTVFIGPQGSGKSALAKLVAIFRDSHFLIRANTNENLNIFFQNFNLQNFNKKQSVFEFKTDTYYVNYNNETFDVGIHEQLIEQKQYETYGGLQYADFEKYMKESKQKNVSPEQELVDTTLLTLAFDTQILKAKYIPTDRYLVSSISSSLWGFTDSNIALPKSMTSFGKNFEFARRTMVKFNSSVLGVTYKFENNEDRVYFNEQEFLTLSESSSSSHAVIPLQLVVEYLRNTEKKNQFIVEEPELNLFPTAQKNLVQYLVQSCSSKENHLHINTHSPYILSAINNLIFAYKVAHEVPEKADEVAQIIPREQWLNPDDVAAYYVADGTVKSIIAEKHGLIGENELDAISEDISGERDQLFKILRSKKRETVN